MTDIVERLTEAAAMRDELKERYWHRASSLKREAADEITRLRQLLSEAEKREKDARRQALGDAARTHEARVTELRNDPTSYKNGKITKSAKRASDFHERSAQVILALQSEDR